MMKLGEKKLKLKNFEEKRDDFLGLLKSEPDNMEKQSAAYGDMINAMAEDFESLIQSESERMANEKFDKLSGYAGSKLTAREVQFFNELTTDVGYKEEILLPEETIDRIFEDLSREHPFLAAINIKTTGLMMRIIKSDVSGQVVWGKIFGEIKGQLDATFSEEEINQSKATAFVVVPKDLKEHGPVWVERFVRTQIVEAFAYALEDKYINGTGKDQPIGMIRQVGENVTMTGGEYPEKESSGVLTFADPYTAKDELTEVMKKLSVKEKKDPNGKPYRVNVRGQVYMLVSSSDVWDVEGKFLVLTAGGAWMTSMPYNIKIVESEVAPEGKAVFFTPKRYDAYIGGGLSIKQYNETLAMEDCDLYTAKQFAYGKADDDTSCLMYTLDIGANEKQEDKTENGDTV